MSDTKLLPCPCCESNRIIHFKTKKNRGYVMCIDCGCRTRACGNYEYKDDLKWKERATILWNTRKPVDRIVEQLEKLETEAFDKWDGGASQRAYLNAIKILKAGGIDG